MNLCKFAFVKRPIPWYFLENSALCRNSLIFILQYLNFYQHFTNSWYFLKNLKNVRNSCKFHVQDWFSAPWFCRIFRQILVYSFFKLLIFPKYVTFFGIMTCFTQIHHCNPGCLCMVVWTSPGSPVRLLFCGSPRGWVDETLHSYTGLANWCHARVAGSNPTRNQMVSEC